MIDIAATDPNPYDHQTALDDLVGLLDLEVIEVNMFRGVSTDENRQRVFGGQVAAKPWLPLHARSKNRAGWCTLSTPTFCVPETLRRRSCTRLIEFETDAASPHGVSWRSNMQGNL